MKDWTDLLARTVLEIRHWFPRQCRDLYTRHHLYFSPHTAEHDGGILISAGRPANPDYQLATAQPIPRNMTEEQVLRHLEPILRRLPVLDPR